MLQLGLHLTEDARSTAQRQSEVFRPSAFDVEEGPYGVSQSVDEYPLLNREHCQKHKSYFLRVDDVNTETTNHIAAIDGHNARPQGG